MDIVTVFAVLMLAFPMNANSFYPKTEKQTLTTDLANIQTVEFTINGMTCSGCEKHVKHGINELRVIVKTNVSYESGNAIIEFDQTQTNNDKIKKSITKSGYSVTDKK